MITPAKNAKENRRWSSNQEFKTLEVDIKLLDLKQKASYHRYLIINQTAKYGNWG
jgi:hypothetical protein